MSLLETLRAIRREDNFTAEFEEALVGKKRGPEPRYTVKVLVPFSPEQIQQMTAKAKAEKRSRNSLVRDAVEFYLSHKASA